MRLPGLTFTGVNNDGTNSAAEWLHQIITTSVAGIIEPREERFGWT